MNYTKISSMVCVFSDNAAQLCSYRLSMTRNIRTMCVVYVELLLAGYRRPSGRAHSLTDCNTSSCMSDRHSTRQPRRSKIEWSERERKRERLGEMDREAENGQDHSIRTEAEYSRNSSVLSISLLIDAHAVSRLAQGSVSLYVSSP